MIIWTTRSDLSVTTPGGATVKLRPGSHNYAIDHKIPEVAEQLRVMRKHSAIGFSELLPCDKEVLKKLPSDAKVEEQAAALKKANLPKNQSGDIKNPKPPVHEKKKATPKPPEDSNKFSKGSKK